MLLNFQRQFTEGVLSGRKQQTIRSAGSRVHVPKLGDPAHCYTGLRTRNTVKLGTWPIIRVDVLRMTITEEGFLTDVLIGPIRLIGTERQGLAKDDGFSDWSEMQAWFARQYPPHDFYGWVIGWDWSRPIARSAS